MNPNYSHIKVTSMQKGFTLVELIMVIILLSVLGMLGGNFIVQSFRGFAQSDNRMEIYEEGKISLVRMEREIHNAIPNAINLVAGPPSELQFVIIDEVAMRTVFGRYTENPPTNTITDAFPATTLPTGSIISIYNRSWNDITTMVAAQRRLYGVVIPPGPPMTLSQQVVPPRSSPQRRYYATNRAIRYFLAGATLMRSQIAIINENFDINTNLPIAAGNPLAQNITALNFTYFPASLTRNAIVTIDFTITRGGEAVNFHKEVHIKNVP